MGDHGQLRSLVERYAAVVDRRRFAELGDVFLSTGVLVTGHGTRDGLDEIRAVMEGLHRYEATDHRVGASRFTVEGDAARGQVECEAHHWSTVDGERIDRVMVITYHDTYERTAAGWRIVHRRLEIHRQEDVPAR